MKAAQYQGLLRDQRHAGVYHEPHGDGDELLRAAEGNGFATFRIDLGTVRDKEDLLATIAAAMEFPDWFGRNWDALDDCLTDLSWRPADGYVVLLEHCDGIHGRAESDFVAAMRAFSRTADAWRGEDVPFWCFVDMQADGISWLPTV